MNNVIISDTSCLITLANIDKLHILRDLYGQVLITQKIQEEFGEPIPEWIHIVEQVNTEKQQQLELKLDPGEASAIALALQTNRATLIIDEIKGRKIAKSLGINIIGTIGIIVLAHKNKIIDDPLSIILQLVNKGFRLSDTLLNKLIQQYKT